MTDEEDEEEVRDPVFNHEVLETLLKKMMDKLKHHLMLRFTNDSYNVMLSDGLASDVVIINGDIPTIKFRTKLFVEVVTKRNRANDFRQMMELALHQIPRMTVSLTNIPKADVKMFDEETRRFKKVSQAEYDRLHPKHVFEKDIHYQTESRTTAIHWSSGTVVREFGPTNESSHNKARRKILSIISNPEIYRRDENGNYQMIESHDDLIHDLVIEASVLTKEERSQLIRELSQ